MPVTVSNTIIKFEDNTPLVGLIYINEVQHLVAWCADNNLALNTKAIQATDCLLSLALQDSLFQDQHVQE